MTKQELVQRMQQGQAWVPGKRVKIDFGGDHGPIMLDGAAQQVTEEDGAAETTIRSFDRSPVPARSAVAVKAPGAKMFGALSDYVDDFDPFAGVFTLFLHLVLLAALFVLQLGAEWHPAPQPLNLRRKPWRPRQPP